MFFLFYFLLSFTKTQTYELDLGFDDLYSFGFEKGGTYSIELKNCPLGSNFILGWISEDKFLKSIDLSSAYRIKTFSGGECEVFNGTIEDKDVYHLAYITNKSVSIELKLDFKNPDSLVDYRYEPLKFITPIFLVIYGLGLVIWLVNWFFNFSVQIGIHYLLTITFSLYFLHRFFLMIYSFYSRKYDANALYVVQVIFSILSLSSLFFFFLIAAKGWCIIKDTIVIKEMIFAVVSSIGYQVFAYLESSVTEGNNSVIILGFEALCFVIYIWDLMRSLNKSSLQITAHLLVISRTGISPETTPVFQKHLLFNKFYISLVLFCLKILLHHILDLFFSLTFWKGPLYDDITDLFLMVFLGWIFRIRGDSSDGYTKFNVDNTQAEVLLSDLDGFSPNNQEEGQPWVAGMSLPASPSIVTVQGPGGVENLQAKEEHLTPIEP